MRYSPDQLKADAFGEWRGPALELERPITGFCHDTRRIEAGELFLALKTEQSDGHAFLEEAYKKGASAALVERVNERVKLPQLKVGDTLKAFQYMAKAHRGRFEGNVIGVTGSCGKTTIKDWLAHLLGRERTQKTHANWNNLLGVPLTLMGIDGDKHAHAVVEAGINQLGEMDKLAWMIQPDLAIVSLIAPTHLALLGTLEELAWQKALLGMNIKPGGRVLFPESCLDYKIFNAFGDAACILSAEGQGRRAICSDSTYIYSLESIDKSSVMIDLNLKDLGMWRLKLPVMSRGMLGNAALVIAAGALMGVSKDAVAERINFWEPGEYRGAVYAYGEQLYYVDCYNANPVAMDDALTFFAEAFDASLDRLYVLGCMGELGEKSSSFHYNVGRQLILREQDKVLLVGSEAAALCEGLRDAGNGGAQVVVLAQREEAWDWLEGFKGAVFLKGSKAYRLWELLPEGATLVEREAAVC